MSGVDVQAIVNLVDDYNRACTDRDAALARVAELEAKYGGRAPVGNIDDFAAANAFLSSQLTAANKALEDEKGANTRVEALKADISRLEKQAADMTMLIPRLPELVTAIAKLEDEISSVDPEWRRIVNVAAYVVNTARGRDYQERDYQEGDGEPTDD